VPAVPQVASYLPVPVGTGPAGQGVDAQGPRSEQRHFGRESVVTDSGADGPKSQVIGGLLDEWARLRPDAEFVTCGRSTFTYAEMAARSDAVAHGLKRLGVGVGDRVAIISPNRIEMIDLYFGVAKTGAIQVPLNSFLKGAFLRHQLVDSQATTLVADREGLAAALPLLDELPGLSLIVTLDPGEPAVREGIAQVALSDLLTTRPVGALPELEPSHVMSIMYTSGSTGLPKGCVLPHGYYLRVSRRIAHMLGIEETDRYYSPNPMFHSAGRMMVLGAALYAGVPVAIDVDFSATAILSRARDFGATIIMGSGSMAPVMLCTPESPADTDHRVHTMFMSPVTVEDQVRFRERFGIDVFVEAYGQTECVPVLAGNRRGGRNRASSGWPVPDLEVALLDDSGRRVPPGAVGEICLRPREPFAMFTGYWNDAEATLRQFEGLWYHTGDNGRELPDGSCAFTDRKKDSLRRRGENVSSMELEDVIAAHECVAEVAVHAVPSDVGEDDIKACLVLKPDATVEPAELFAFFCDQLPYFAIPRYVEFVDALPRTAVGRVMKHVLRARPTASTGWDFCALGLEVAREDRRSVSANRPVDV
jgi:crotonobetaine/carnitine-CoA ligase